MQQKLTVAMNGQKQVILWLQRQSFVHSSGAAAAPSPLVLASVSYRTLAQLGGLHGAGAFGGVFRTEYRGLLRFLLDETNLSGISARQLIGRRARAVTRSGGLRPTYRQRLASDAACCV